MSGSLTINRESIRPVSEKAHKSDEKYFYHRSDLDLDEKYSYHRSDLMVDN